jgi:hypothetical protein
LSDSHDIGSHAIGLEPTVDVLAKFFFERAPRRFREEIDPKVRRADLVGLLHDEVAAMVEATGRSRKRKRNHQSHQAEHCSVRGAQASRFVSRRSKMLDPQAPAGFHRQQHSAEEQQQHHRRHSPIEAWSNHVADCSCNNLCWSFAPVGLTPGC